MIWIEIVTSSVSMIILKCPQRREHCFYGLITLDSGTNVGLHSLFLKNFEEEKNKKLPQYLDWCKKVLKSWCENFYELLKSLQLGNVILALFH